MSGLLLFILGLFLMTAGYFWPGLVLAVIPIVASMPIFHPDE